MFPFGLRRAQSGIGARLALLAIALQLVLSFAHIHQLPLSQATISAPAQSGGGSDLPLAGDDCAICANIAAFASLDLPEQAEFLAPTARAEILAPILVALSFRPVAFRHFSSRAPPVSA